MGARRLPFVADHVDTKDTKTTRSCHAVGDRRASVRLVTSHRSERRSTDAPRRSSRRSGTTRAAGGRGRPSPCSGRRRSPPWATTPLVANHVGTKDTKTARRTSRCWSPASVGSTGDVAPGRSADRLTRPGAPPAAPAPLARLLRTPGLHSELKFLQRFSSAESNISQPRLEFTPKIDRLTGPVVATGWACSYHRLHSSEK